MKLTTHSQTCWRYHADCARQRVEMLKEALQGLLLDVDETKRRRHHELVANGAFCSCSICEAEKALWHSE